MARPRLLHLRFQSGSAASRSSAKSNRTSAGELLQGDFPLHRLRPWSPSPRISDSAALGTYATEQQLSEAFLRFLQDKAPKVEPVGRSEVLLDLSGCERLYPERGSLLAEINRELPKDSPLVLAAGEGATRLVARLAAAVAPAGSWWSVEPGASASFLAPFPLQCVKDEFPAWVEALQELGLLTLGDLAAIPFELLHRALGLGVRPLWEDARGEGSHAVHHRLEMPLLRARHRFQAPQSEPGLVASALKVLADRLAVELRSHRLVTGRIQLRLGFHGGARASRSRVLAPASDELESIRRAAWALWREESGRRTAVTRCELRAEVLRERPPESLCFDFVKARNDLAPAIRSIRRRYGTGAIRWSPELWMD